MCSELSAFRCNFYTKQKLGVVTPVSDCNLIPAVTKEESKSKAAIDDWEARNVLQFDWYQSPLRAVCFFHQNRLSLYNCTLTNRNYCSRACYFVGFHQVRRQLCSNQTCKINVVSNLNVYGISTNHLSSQSLRGDNRSVWAYYKVLRRHGFILSREQNLKIWAPISHERGIYPRKEDIGRQFKLCVSVRNKRTNEVKPVKLSVGMGECQSSIVTEVCLPSGPVAAANGALISVGDDNLAEKDKFTILSWNVLCDIYTTEEVFGHTQPAYLAWEYRRHRVLAQIEALGPDILCLQEVQSDHFRNIFEPTLKGVGYVGFFKSKKNKGYVKGHYIIDGCATFYRMTKFRAVHMKNAEYANLITRKHSDVVNSAAAGALSRLMRDNVLVSLTLERVDLSVSEGYKQYRIFSAHHDTNPGMAGAPCYSKDNINGPLVTVVNTHILANPEYADVKFWQTATLLQHTAEYMKAVNDHIQLEQRNMLHGLMICGDFNSTPGSAVYTYIVKGQADCKHPELRDDAHGLLKKGDKDRFVHEFRLKSMNAQAICKDKGIDASKYESNHDRLRPFRNTIGICEPVWTNCTPCFSGCLDYIFFDPTNMVLASAMMLPMENMIAVEGELNSNLTSHFPMPNRPSDHLQLFGKFAFSKNHYI